MLQSLQKRSPQSTQQIAQDGQLPRAQKEHAAASQALSHTWHAPPCGAPFAARPFAADAAPPAFPPPPARSALALHWPCMSTSKAVRLHAAAGRRKGRPVRSAAAAKAAESARACRARAALGRANLLCVNFCLLRLVDAGSAGRAGR